MKRSGHTKVIDAHAHVGRFGSWANVSCSDDELLEKMDEANVERAVLFAPDNQLVRKRGTQTPQEARGIRMAEPARQRGALVSQVKQ